MSESIGKPRQSVNLDEFERRLRVPEPSRAGGDPLAELARLVEGGNDALDRGVRVSAPQPHVAAPDPMERFENVGDPIVVPADIAADLDRVREPARLPPRPEHFEFAPPPVPQPQPAPVAQAHDHIEYAAPEPYHHEAPAPQPAEAAHDDYAAWRDEQAFSPEVAEEVARPKRSRTAMYAMSGALALVVAGIGTTFALKGGPGALRGEAPMIKAAAGPTKVQPETTASTPSSNQSVAVLDKGGDKVGASKVVGSVEQPVDVATQARPARPSAQQTANGGNPFPEPKKVRTVSVRPDGSIVGADIPVATTPPPSAQAAPTRSVALPPASSPAPAPVAAAPSTPAVAARPAPAPAAPKATTRVATRTDLQDDAEKPKPAAAAAKPVAPRPRADADPNKPIATTVGGGFAVQVGLGSTDAEARAKANQAASQFGSQLGGRHPSVVKAEVNGKTVYRVRVVGLTQESATAMCGKIKGGGGDCFVAR